MLTARRGIRSTGEPPAKPVGLRLALPAEQGAAIPGAWSKAVSCAAWWNERGVAVDPRAGVPGAAVRFGFHD